MIDGVKIVGDAVVGSVLVAVSDYWGGSQGASTFKWIRVKDGHRQSEGPFAIDPNFRFDPESTQAGLASGDPRFRAITEVDLGATFKVTCTPVRSDGTVGEPKTSARSQAIM